MPYTEKYDREWSVVHQRGRLVFMNENARVGAGYVFVVPRARRGDMCGRGLSVGGCRPPIRRDSPPGRTEASRARV